MINQNLKNGLEVFILIFWIEKIYKNEYINSAKQTGIRYKFSGNFDEDTKTEVSNFITFIRKHYYFPIRLNVLFCNNEKFIHHLDGHKYYAAFYSYDDEKRKIYPRIYVASMITKKNPLEDVLFAVAHEITHYYQWYFLVEDKRTDRSLEIEANKWAIYVLELYLDCKTNC